MLDLVTGFAAELRTAGVPVSVTETTDALAAIAHTPLADRRALRHTLGATLVKDRAHQAAFEVLFDVWFTAGPPGPDRDGPQLPAPLPGPAPARPDRRGRGLRGLTGPELDGALVGALLAGDRQLVSATAAEAVTRYATIEPARPMTGRYYVYRTLRSLHADTLPGRLAAAAGPAPDALAGRVRREEHAAAVGYLHGEVESEVRRRLVAGQGPRAVAGVLRPRLPQDTAFLGASDRDLAQLQELLAPLARRLAVRLRERQRQRGAFDFRATVRRSLSYGGALADLRFTQRRRARPEIMVVADVSGSVAGFARFTLMLVHAVAAQFSRVRTFVFIDTTDEVTGLAAGLSLPDLASRISREARAVSASGHSDYGHALEMLWRRWGHEVTPRTTVLILGDGRNNRHEPQDWVLRELSARARHLYWLNPEPRVQWFSGDSAMADYAPHCDAVVECRNVRQLGRFVAELL